MNKRKEQELSILRQYLPEEYELFVANLLEKHPISFKIVNPRQSKLGDFKAHRLTGKVQITINGNLNPYSFLITTIHEFAHFITYKKYGLAVKAHGKEWKEEYARLSSRAIHFGNLPKDVEIAFINSLVNIKASCSDVSLMRVLNQYDLKKTNKTNIESIAKNDTFVYQNKIFKLIEKRRTRYLCEELTSKKQFLFHALAEIELYE